MGEVATISDKPLPSINAGAPVRAIVPQSFDDAYRIAKAVCMAGMAPKGLDTNEKAMIAIMHGAEVGLPPMQALQSIAVINGRPSIWGDGAMGLVRGSGLLEYADEEVTGEGDAMVAACKVKRRGERGEIRRTFSVADAKAAGLWGKKGRSGEPTPWITYPKRMLAMRARAFALRDGFADVLRGLYIAEEAMDIPTNTVRDITPPPAPPPPEEITQEPQETAPSEPEKAEEEISPPSAESVDPETGEIIDGAKLLPPTESAALKSGLLKRLGTCGATKAVGEWNKSADAALPTMQPEDRQEVEEQRDALLAELFDREQADNPISAG